MSETQQRKSVSHVARNPVAVGAKGIRLALCGRFVPAEGLTAEPSDPDGCVKCRKAWRARWRQAEEPPAAGFIRSAGASS